MLRRVFWGWSLIAVLLIAGTWPAAADEDADKIRAGIEWYLQSLTAGYPGAELRHEIEITPVDEEYEVVVRNVTVADRDSGDAYPLGDFFVRVDPLENGDYRYHSVRVPEEIRIVDPTNTENSAAVRLGLEKLEGVMSPRAGYAYASEMLARNFSVKFKLAQGPESAGGGLTSIDLLIEELTGNSSFQEPRENAVDQDVALKLRNLSLDFSDGGSLRIGESETDIALSIGDVVSLLTAHENIQNTTADLAELNEVDEQAELAFMRSVVDVYAAIGKYVQGAKVKNLTYDSPAVKLGMQESQLDFEALNLDQDLSSQDVLISTRGFFLSLPAIPGMDAALTMLPRRWTLPIKLQRVPVKAIIGDTQSLLADLSSPREIDQGSPRVEAYTAQLGERIRDAGMTIVFDGQSIESDVVTATMDGSLVIDPDNPIGVEGNLAAQAVGLMQLFEQAQTIPDPQAAQQVMQGAMLLLSTGETVPGGQVPSVTNYRFEFTPEGAILLNGNQMHPPEAPAE